MSSTKTFSATVSNLPQGIRDYIVILVDGGSLNFRPEFVDPTFHGGQRAAISVRMVATQYLRSVGTYPSEITAVCIQMYANKARVARAMCEAGLARQPRDVEQFLHGFSTVQYCTFEDWNSQLYEHTHGQKELFLHHLRTQECQRVILVGSTWKGYISLMARIDTRNLLMAPFDCIFHETGIPPFQVPVEADEADVQHVSEEIARSSGNREVVAEMVSRARLQAENERLASIAAQNSINMGPYSLPFRIAGAHRWRREEASPPVFRQGFGACRGLQRPEAAPQQRVRGSSSWSPPISVASTWGREGYPSSGIGQESGARINIQGAEAAVAQPTKLSGLIAASEPIPASEPTVMAQPIAKPQRSGSGSGALGVQAWMNLCPPKTPRKFPVHDAVVDLPKDISSPTSRGRSPPEGTEDGPSDASTRQSRVQKAWRRAGSTPGIHGLGIGTLTGPPSYEGREVGPSTGRSTPAVSRSTESSLGSESIRRTVEAVLSDKRASWHGSHAEASSRQSTSSATGHPSPPNETHDEYCKTQQKVWAETRKRNRAIHGSWNAKVFNKKFHGYPCMNSTSLPSDGRPEIAGDWWGKKDASLPTLGPSSGGNPGPTRVSSPPPVTRDARGRRIDPPIPYSATIVEALADRAICNNFHLRAECNFGGNCKLDHSDCTEKEVDALRFLARRSKCRNGPSCNIRVCWAGHRCLNHDRKRGSGCSFDENMHFKPVEPYHQVL